MAISAQHAMNEIPFVVEIQEQQNANERLLKAFDEVYNPVLKLMKLFGTYFGYTNLKQVDFTSVRSRKQIHPAHIYCVVAISGFWFNFVMAFVEIFVESDIFLFIKLSLWLLFIALNGTISLSVLPLTGTRKSRFEIFLGNALAVIKSVNLEKVKAKSRKGLIVFFCFYITAVATVIVLELLVDFNLATFKPWNHWFGLRILSTVFLIIGNAVWLLPILFHCNTCLILEECWDDLHKRMSSFRLTSIDLEALKIEYHKLCGLVELADKMLAPLLLGMVSLYIPLLCFSFYSVVHLPEEDSLVFLVTNLVWLLLAAGILAVILLFGSKVSEKVYHGNYYLFHYFSNSCINQTHIIKGNHSRGEIWITGLNHYTFLMILLFSVSP